MEETTNPNQVIVSVDASGTIACTPDPVHAKGRSALLSFVLQADGYVFPQNGAIVVNTPSPQFPQPSNTLPPNNTTATLLDLNTTAGDFKYTVTVQTASGKLLQLDPTINNGG